MGPACSIAGPAGSLQTIATVLTTAAAIIAIRWRCNVQYCCLTEHIGKKPWYQCFRNVPTASWYVKLSPISPIVRQFHGQIQTINQTDNCIIFLKYLSNIMSNIPKYRQSILSYRTRNGLARPVTCDWEQKCNTARTGYEPVKCDRSSCIWQVFHLSRFQLK